MKNLSKALTICVLFCIVMFTLAACGSSSDSESTLEGNTYVFTSYTVDDEDQTETITAMYSAMSLTFGSDGVCTQSITWSDEYAEALGITEAVEQEGTYEEDSDSVTVTFASDEGDTVMEFTIDGDAISMEEDGCITTYTAQ